MNRLYSTPLLLTTLLLSASLSAGAEMETEERSFFAMPGDGLVVHNDYGRVLVEGWERNEVEVRIRRIASHRERLDNVVVQAQKSGSKIYVHAYFYEYESESVYLDIRAPRYMNLHVWGANPAVELSHLDGYVRVQTLTGLISVEELTSSVSLMTESGDVFYRAGSQPKGDVRLESIRGNVRCFLHEDLDLRSYVRAGDRLSWNREVELTNASLDRSMGSGGPLLYAGSLEGGVQVRLEQRVERRLAGGMDGFEPVGGRAEDLGSLFDEEAAASPPQDRSPEREGDGGSHAAFDTDPESSRPVVQTSTVYEPSAGSPEPVAGDALDLGYSLSVNVEWIYLNVSVREHSTNRAVANLRKEDFLVYEDGVPQRVERFETADAPFSLLLLLDVSGSTSSFIQLIRDASVDFTRQIGALDQVAVAVFNSDVSLIQGFTNDRRELERAIRSIRAGGGTAFYDALDTSVHEYMRGIEGRKAVVVFTDGVDNRLTGHFGSGSRLSFEEMFRGIQESDTLIYTIFLDTLPGFARGGGGVGGILADILRGGMGGPRGRRPGGGRVPGGGGSGGGTMRAAYEEAERQLQAIADQTGGRLYNPRRIEDLAPAYQEVADDLRIQYTLGYSSTNPIKDGKWREIRVQVKDRTDLIARTRRGYYAVTESASGRPSHPTP